MTLFPVLKTRLSQCLALLVLSTALSACAQPPKGHARSAAKAAPQAASSNASEKPSAPDGDAVILEMANAFKRNDARRLSQLLPAARGHILEPWAAYWELKVRLEQASEAEVRAFLARYAHSYQEDRLRNDWLLLLGSRRDWTTLADEHVHYRMRDDREVQCYVGLVEFLTQGPRARADLPDELYRLWMAQREGDEGCAFAADRLFDGGRLSAAQIWRKARTAAEAGRQKSTRQAVEIVQPKGAPGFNDMWSRPARWLGQYASNPRSANTEWAVLALTRLAATDVDAAAKLMRTLWQPALSAEQRDWVWGMLGRQTAMQLDDQALVFYRRVDQPRHLSDEMLAWWARAALRAEASPQWAMVEMAIRAMSPQARQEAVWVYWLARADMARHPASHEAHKAALKALEELASPRGFYEQLALEALGRKVTVPPRPAPPTEAELGQARQNPSLKRALYAISMGLRSEGVREWNYGAHLVNAQGLLGRMTDREMLATAALACEQQIWDRCINTSERMRSLVDVEQSFPMPLRDAVLQRSRKIDLDPAYVYGLIRQESRFVMDARSHVGASGLMQVMPATAKWTARKIGLDNFRPEQITQHDTNIAIGTGYLKIVLDNFEGSMPLATAAYNAGPGRARKWRQGRELDGAIWAENIPFNETRDYVKKVLSNTTLYAAIITGQPQSLSARLSRVGPPQSAAPDNADIP
jgi:soluble lytic murein transglycosylase